MGGLNLEESVTVLLFLKGFKCPIYGAEDKDGKTRDWDFCKRQNSLS